MKEIFGNFWLDLKAYYHIRAAAWCDKHAQRTREKAADHRRKERLNYHERVRRLNQHAKVGS